MNNGENFEFTIKLNSPKEVIIFTKMAENYEANIDVQSYDKHYTVDAKSVMGIFGLSLIDPLIVSTKDIETGKSFMNDVIEYVIF